MYTLSYSSIALLGATLLGSVVPIYASPVFSRQNGSPPNSVKGQVDPRFNQIRNQFQLFLDENEELGSSLSINIKGTDVVNLWGGYSDINKTKAWNQDTMVNVWSTTKTLVSLAALTLVEKGQLDVNERVATYWPKFAASGKQDILVRHLMSHTAGLAAFATNTTLEEVYNATRAAEKLGAQEALWPERNISGYHAITYGFPIGELIRRITGKSMKQYIQDEIAGPLGADFQIGLAEKDWNRAAELIYPNPIQAPNPDPDSISLKAFINPPFPVELTTTPEWRNAEIGASNGHCTATGLTKVLSLITLGGEVDGHKLLSPETIDLIFQQQASGEDLVLQMPVTFGIGYGLVRANGSLTGQAVPQGNGRVAYWGGMGGSMAFMDVDNGITFGYVMNKMRGDLTGTKPFQAYVKTLYETLGIDGGSK